MESFDRFRSSVNNEDFEAFVVFQVIVYLCFDNVLECVGQFA